MRILIIALMLVCSTAHAEINEKYSFKDFTGIKFLDVDPAEFNDSEIKGSCFYQESSYRSDSLGNSARNPMVNIFPAGMRGVTFTRCNLDNVRIPSGNTIGERNSHRKIRVQNDLIDWILGNDNKPLSPIGIDRRIEAGVSVLPSNIPSKKFTEKEDDAFKDIFNNIDL